MPGCVPLHIVNGAPRSSGEEYFNEKDQLARELIQTKRELEDARMELTGNVYTHV